MLRLRIKCNPDFEQQYPSVVRWYGEVDPSRRRVLREVGLDANGRPVVCGPIGRNYGFWTGVSGWVGVSCGSSLDKDVFEAAWELLFKNYRGRARAKQSPPIPICGPEQIMGDWSTTILSGPGGGGSMQSIAFFPDGTGIFKDYNYSLMYHHEFLWNVVEIGRLSIKGTACVQNDEQRFKKPSDFVYESVTAETQVFRAGDEHSVEVLHLPLRKQNFNWVAEAYGRPKFK